VKLKAIGLIPGLMSSRPAPDNIPETMFNIAE
jgi:hypothetical protein